MSRESLIRRVTWVGAAAAALGGMLAAGVAGLLAAGLVSRHDDGVLRRDAIELAAEIREDLEGDEDDPPPDKPRLDAELADELPEVDRPGASAVIRSPSGQLRAGDDSLPRLEPDACERIDVRGAPRLVCAVELGDDILVLGIDAVDNRQRLELIGWALVAGALIGAVLGGLASLWSARWALAPLTALRDRVKQIDADAPSTTGLTPSDQLEVEELRVAIVGLVERLAVSLSHAQSFASQAAHELRTPLSVLAGELELLAETPGVDRPAVERLLRRVRELIALVQRLLMLAGTGKLAAEHAEAVDLADVIDAVRGDLPSELAARVHGSSDDDLLVRGDAELLRAMLSNAVNNALKFSRDEVEVRASARGSEVWLEIIDRGPGVSAEDRERVFIAFVRGVHARADGTPGHGIGLALIRHVASVHGGRCEFVDVDAGAHLRIRLPRWT
jgi:signal transduction histidine kinase